jgi:RNA polymerase sigma-70 factor (ECF subfamily)
MPLASPHTPLSLLDRICNSEGDAWRALVTIYEPLLRHWLRAASLQSADEDDLTQQILTVLVRKLPTFRHNGREGAFRAWLRSITLLEVAEFQRRRSSRPALCDSEALDVLPCPIDELTRTWDAEYDRHVLYGLLELIKSDFKPSAWRVFQRVALEGLAPQTVAGEMGLTVNAVSLIKSRILRRLRQEARGLVD